MAKMTGGGYCAACGVYVSYGAFQHICAGPPTQSLDRLRRMAPEAPSTETRVAPMTPAQIRQIVREELERFQGARTNVFSTGHSAKGSKVNFTSVSLIITLPNGTTQSAAQALEDKLAAFATQNNLPATITFSVLESVGPPAASEKK